MEQGYEAIGSDNVINVIFVLLEDISAIVNTPIPGRASHLKKHSNIRGTETWY